MYRLYIWCHQSRLSWVHSQNKTAGKRCLHLLDESNMFNIRTHASRLHSSLNYKCFKIPPSDLRSLGCARFETKQWVNEGSIVHDSSITAQGCTGRIKVVKGLTFINSPVTSESSMLHAWSTPIDHLQTKEITVEVETQNFFIYLLHGPPPKPKKKFWDCQLQILPLASINLTRMCFEHRSPQPWHTFFSLFAKTMLLSGSSWSQFWCHKASCRRWQCFLGFHFLFCRILYQVWVQQKHVLWCPSSNGSGYTNQKPYPEMFYRSVPKVIC